MLDPILSEIREFRDAFAEQFHGDVTAMLADLRATGDASGRKTVTLTPRWCQPPDEQVQSGDVTKENVVLPPKRRIHSEPDIAYEEKG